MRLGLDNICGSAGIGDLRFRLHSDLTAQGVRLRPQVMNVWDESGE